MRFLVGALTKVQNQFESSFLIKYFIITVPKKFERFGQYLKKVKKNGFPIVFSKTDFPLPPFQNQARGLKFSGSYHFYANHYWFILWNDWNFFSQLSSPYTNV